MDKELAIKIFNDLLDELNMNPKQLSESLGKKRPQWAYDILNKDKKVGISRNIVDLICSKYPQISKSWLLTGEGKRLKDDKSIIELEQIPTEEKIGKFFTENTNGVKFYDLGNGKYRMLVKHVPFCAYGRFANEADTLEPDKEDWEEDAFEVSKIVHGNYLSFEVKGESMDDGTRSSFESGDRVLVRELGKEHWMEKIRYRDYPFWVVAFGSSVLIKQIVEQDLKNGTITLHSLNPSPEYCDFKLSLDEIRKLYYVVQKKPKIVSF